VRTGFHRMSPPLSCSFESTPNTVRHALGFTANSVFFLDQYAVVILEIGMMVLLRLLYHDRAHDVNQNWRGFQACSAVCVVLVHPRL